MLQASAVPRFRVFAARMPCLKMPGMRCLLLIPVFASIGLVGTLPAAAGEPLRLAQIAPSETELRIYAGLHAAAAEGDAAAIERLVAAGKKPNLQDSRSRTPLHVAAFSVSTRWPAP